MKNPEIENAEADDDLLQFAAAFRQAKPVLPPAAMERVANAMRAEMAKRSPAAIPEPLSYVKFRVAAAALIAVGLALFWTLPRQSIPMVAVTPKRPEVRATYLVDVPRFPAPKPGAALLRTEEYESLFQ